MHGLSSLKSSARYELRSDQTFDDIFKIISSGEISCGDGWLLDPELVNLRVQSHMSKTVGFRIVTSTVGTAVRHQFWDLTKPKFDQIHVFLIHNPPKQLMSINIINLTILIQITKSSKMFEGTLIPCIHWFGVISVVLVIVQVYITPKLKCVKVLVCVQYHRNIVTAEIKISYLIMKIEASYFFIPLCVSTLLWMIWKSKCCF